MWVYVLNYSIKMLSEIKNNVLHETEKYYESRIKTWIASQKC